MFSGLAAKLQQKKKETVQSTAAEDSEAEIAKSIAALAEKKKVDDSLIITAKLPVSSQPNAEVAQLDAAPSRRSAPAPAPEPRLMSCDAFEAYRENAITETRCWLQSIEVIVTPLRHSIARLVPVVEGSNNSQRTMFGIPTRILNGVFVGAPPATSPESSPSLMGIYDWSLWAPWSGKDEVESLGENVLPMRLGNELRLGLLSLKELSPTLKTTEDPNKWIAETKQQQQLSDRSESRRVPFTIPTTISSSNPLEAAEKPQVERFVVFWWIMRALLIWRAMILKHCVTYEVYRAEHRQFSAEEMRSRSLAVAAAREDMSAYSNSHNALMKILAALLSDFSKCSLCDAQPAEEPLAKKSRSEHSPIVPDQLLHGLYYMIVHAVKRNQPAAEQAYFDTVVGTDKWRLGLFSAGDMHMRTTLEKTQRDRVRHLLNNEQAMEILHSVKRLLPQMEAPVPV